MKIGIIGIGNIGGALARKLAAAGHAISVANSSGAQAVRPFAEQIGAQAVDVHGAVTGVDVVIIAIPLPAIRKLPAGLFADVAADVTVIDTSNYYPGLRDDHITEIDDGMPESVWVAQQLGRSVVKAFNNVLAHTLAELGLPPQTAGRLAIAVAGDSEPHKRTAMALVDETGFDPVDAGALADSWRQQPSTPSYCCDYDAATMREALAAAVPGEAAAKRDRLPELFAKLGANPSHEDVIAMNRKVNGPVQR